MFSHRIAQHLAIRSYNIHEHALYLTEVLQNVSLTKAFIWTSLLAGVLVNFLSHMCMREQGLCDWGWCLFIYICK